MTLYVDGRYQGAHGIGRYATEVLDRIDLDLVSLTVNRKPTDPLAFLEPGWRTAGGTDLIYSPGFNAGPSRARQFLTVHDLIHLEAGGPWAKTRAHRLYYEGIIRPTIRRAGHVFTVSQASAAALKRWLGDSRVQIHVTGNGCSAEFVPEGRSIERDRPFLLVVGNTRSHKNVGVALRAMRCLTEFDLVAVVSDGDALLQMAAKLGVADRITVLSGLDDPTLAAYYRGAEVLLFPSVLEGFGLPALEALSCGTPVVYYRGCASVHEIVQRDSWSVLSAHDEQAFANAVRVASEAREVVVPGRVRYDWSEVADRVRSVLVSS